MKAAGFARTRFGVRRVTELIAHAEFLSREAVQRVGFDRARIYVIPQAASRRLS